MLFKNNFISKYSTLKFKNRLEHFIHLYSYTPFNKKKLLLNPDLNIDSIENRLKDKFQAIFDSISKESYYNKTMLVFIKVHLVGLLHRVDTTTMATSVEARVPFVDHRLVEFSASLPFKYKLRWKSKDSKKLSKLLMSDKISELYDIPKYLLKKSYEKHLPKKILYRKKVGFPVPLDSWFGGELNSYAKEILLSKEARERGVYNNKYLERLLTSKNDIRDNKIGMKIWMLVNLEIFFKKYFDKTF
jgi:asparagine synthase (glutamine-hydrolysing)